ncbi:arylsulfatase [Galbibacter sp. BG1]|uniref:arylsulfatase n=1 Tax=Galbibacter sp. BG1 TaxID=1170699 RepID=UPI0015B9CC93|nr:arylsulfatase [Galbibacter sp. BG1]QLE02615.1 arylsulfatase [Galbibacter sp. BG1]
MNLLLFLTFLWTSVPSFDTVPSSDRPNIIIILADDLGYSDIGCYGSEIKTPNLNKLASFSQFYNNTRCCPSRAALLTGFYPHQVGIGAMTDTDIPIPEYQGYFGKNVKTIADLLKDIGYKTFISGKWHVGEKEGHWPKDHGFDESFALINGASSYFDFKPYRNDLWPLDNEIKVVANNEVLDMSEEDFYATDLYTDKALNMLAKHITDEPFFLYLSYTAPHWPLHALPEDIKKYEGSYDSGWDVIRESRFEKLKALNLIENKTVLSGKNPDTRDWNALNEEERKYEARLMEVYAAMIDRMDQNIGKLIDYLSVREELDNTVIIFLSDNGGCSAGNLANGKYSHPRLDPKAEPGTPTSFTGYGPSWANVSNTPFREFKSNIHEGGIATPFILWYPPEINSGIISKMPSHIIDVVPTLLDICGVYKNEATHNTLEGTSLLPFVTEKETNYERPLYFEHEGNCGVILENWKAVKNYNKDWELYNLSVDRSETNNLASEMPNRLKQLVIRYNEWARENRVLPYEEVKKAIPYRF